MKSQKAAVRSFKNLVVKTNSSQTINPNTTFGVTIIPEGNSNVFVALPNLQNTYTYNIINTDEMSGNITLNTSAGASLRGLILNTVGGLSIDTIEVGTASITMESDNADGSYISLLSNGNYWYMWSIVSGGSISIGNVSGDIVGLTPSNIVTYANVTVNANPVDTVSFPAPQLVARHVLTYQGTAEANATITITTVATNGGTAVNDFTVTADAIGEWSASFSDILNGTYKFTFTDLGAPIGAGVVSATSDVEEKNDGPLSFTTPTSFDLDPGEVFDFTANVSAAEPDGTPIAVITVSSDFTGKTHGQTFDIVYSFTYLGTPYSRTVSGLVADDTPPSKPVILTATFDAVNLDELTVTGTTDIGTTLKLYKDSVYLGEATVDGAGDWTFTTTIVFNQTFNLTAQANDSATPIAGDNRSFPNYSALSDPFAASLNTPTLVRPTLLVTDQLNAVFTNAANNFTLTGTTAIGSTITLFNGSTQITPVLGPIVDVAGDWEATITALPESINSLTAKATKAGSNENTSSAFSLKVDRVAPVINNNQPLGALTVYLGGIGANNDSVPTATDFSSATVTSDWATQVDATEGVKTVTYTATDAASNSATTTRTVNVSTEVIVPENLTVATGVGTATISGVVSGTYAGNLVVKIYVTDGNGLETVYQESGTDVEFPVNSGVFSASLTLSADDYTFHATTVNSEDEESSPSQETSQVTIAAAPDTVIPVITLLGNASESFTEGGSYSDAGATAFDDVDGDITSDIVTTIVDSSDVTAVLDSTTAPGVYTISYDVIDSSNNDADTVTRTVEVLAAANFLEDLSSITLHGLATISSGIFSRNKVGSGGGVHGANFNLVDEGIVAFNSDGTRVEEELTVSFWFRPDETWADNWYYIGGHTRGAGTEFRLAVRDNGGFLEFRSIFFSTTQYKNSPSTSALNTGEWYHLAVTYSANGSNHDLKMFVNGEKVEEDLNLTGNLMKMTNATKDFALGGYTSGDSVGGNTLNHSSDSWQIASGTALTESQVAAIYNQSDRLMTIATAAALPNASAAFIEDNAGALAVTADADLFDDSGNIIFRNFPPGATTAGYAQGDWSDYVTYSGGSFSYTSMTISLWFNPKEHFTSNNLTTMRLFSSRETSGTDGVQLLVKRSSTNFYTIQLSYYYDGAWRTKNLNGNSGESAASFTIDSWRHIVAVFDGSDILVFLDGVFIDGVAGFSVSSQLTESLIGSPNDSSATFTLGASNDGSNTVDKNVYIDSVEIAENLTIDASQATTLFADSTRQTSIRDV